MGDEDALTKMLRERKERAEKAPDPNEVKREWLERISELVALVRSAIEEQVREGLLSLKETTEALNEERLGAYRAPGLVVQSEYTNGASVTIRPRARIVLGARGRVDLERVPRNRSHNVEAMFTLNLVQEAPDGAVVWCLAGKDRHGKPVVTRLTEQLIRDEIARLLS